MTEVKTFKLSDDFIKPYKGKQPQWGPIGYIIYKRTYSRSLCKKCKSYDLDVDENWKRLCAGCGSKDITSEEYWETCRRVVEGTFSIQKNHCQKNMVPWYERKAQNTAQKMFEKMWEFKFTPPGRGLEFMGSKKVEKCGSAPLNNCGFVSTEYLSTDYPEPFLFMMDMSMLGIGVGFDTKGADKITIKEPKVTEESYVVEDSREGWIELIKMILGAYTHNGNSLHTTVDYSGLRPKGAPLKTMGGVSSGSEPLKELAKDLNNLLAGCIGKKLSSTNIVDIMNLIGKCVVAGGRRRTAQIAFGHKDDVEFSELKDPEKHKTELYSHRWASNNSLFAEVGMDYSQVASKTARNGEPGYLWIDNVRKYSRMDGKTNNKDYRAAGANPCSEQTLESYELCTLVESYMPKHDSLEEWYDTLKYAYLYAKTVTLLATHNPKTNAVMSRNRRIGLSISGITQAFKKFGRRNVLNAMRKGYDIVQDWDKIYSEWLGVPRSIKTTSIKPSGTVSLLMGCTPGIHYHPASEYYIRRVRIEDTSMLLEPIKEAGYKIEKDAYAPNTFVVEFPIREGFFERTEKNVSMWEQLEVAAQVQECWSDNQVSVTIKFKPEEAKDIKYALELYETRLKSVSFLPEEKHNFKQPPYEPITKEQYEKMTKDSKKPKFSGETHEVSEKYCDGGVCMVKLAGQ